MIRIKPYYAIERVDDLMKVALPQDYLWHDRDYLFFNTGKSAIHYLINKLNLTREDEVCIFTSTDSNYVSTCVSATFFNYCKLSRVPTEKTKLLYVIHEFGLPHPHIEKLVADAQRLKIPLVEDCAHALDSYINNKKIGTWGDFAIYSLSKHLPMENAGLLVGNDLSKANCFFDEEVSKEIEAVYQQYLPLLKSLSQRKKDNYSVFSSVFSNEQRVAKFANDQTPHLAVFKTSKYKELYRTTGSMIEMHPLHVKNWFALSVQPLLTPFEIEDILATILKQLKT